MYKYYISIKFWMKFRFFVNGQVTTRRSNHTRGQATRTVKQQQKKAKDVSQTRPCAFECPQWLQKPIQI